MLQLLNGGPIIEDRRGWRVSLSSAPSTATARCSFGDTNNQSAAFAFHLWSWCVNTLYSPHKKMWDIRAPIPNFLGSYVQVAATTLSVPVNNVDVNATVEHSNVGVTVGCSRSGVYWRCLIRPCHEWLRALCIASEPPSVGCTVERRVQATPCTARLHLAALLSGECEAAIVILTKSLRLCTQLGRNAGVGASCCADPWFVEGSWKQGDVPILYVSRRAGSGCLGLSASMHRGTRPTLGLFAQY